MKGEEEGGGDCHLFLLVRGKKKKWGSRSTRSPFSFFRRKKREGGFIELFLFSPNGREKEKKERERKKGGSLQRHLDDLHKVKPLDNEKRRREEGPYPACCSNRPAPQGQGEKGGENFYKVGATEEPLILGDMGDEREKEGGKNSIPGYTDESCKGLFQFTQNRRELKVGRTRILSFRSRRGGRKRGSAMQIGKFGHPKRDICWGEEGERKKFNGCHPITIILGF